ncbi:hypothetical protein E2C01_030914 [Portunus trituberculatus]|uniref:Uncharacterized protein n=1 Tax=Portunus trituberculatus TaxID=210409 RepID=A0A5B7EVG5_PORTR|nr:hypothetical protein [Portunus trituberculatus]
MGSTLPRRGEEQDKVEILAPRVADVMAHPVDVVFAHEIIVVVKDSSNLQPALACPARQTCTLGLPPTCNTM